MRTYNMGGRDDESTESLMASDIAASDAVTDEPELKRRNPIIGFFVTVFRMLVAVALGLGLAYLTKTYIVEQFEVPTGSMIPTIHEHDRVLGEKITYYMRDPEPGDIIVFEDPVTDGAYLLCKRVIAVGGQTVELVNGQAIVDGTVSPYGDGLSLPLDSDVTYPYTVPAGYVWCMGDNREHSADSREFGAVPIDSIRAKGWVIIAPKEHWTVFE